MIISNLPLILSLMGSGIAALWAYFTNKKNKKLSLQLQEISVKLREADVDSSKIRVANENFEFYQTMLDDAHSRYQILMTQYEQETAKLSKLLEEARKMVDTHEQYISQQRLYISDLEELLNKNNININKDARE